MAGKQIGVTLKFIDDFSKGFNASLKALTEGTKNAQKLSKQVINLGKDIQNVGKTMTAAVTLPIVGLGIKAVNTAKDVEDAMASVMTLQDKMTDTYDEAKTSIRKYSLEFGKSFSEVADSYYTLTSAFTDTSKVQDGLKTVMELSLAGKTEADAAAKAIATAFNAYGGDIQHIGDIIASTQTYGFTTIAELSEDMGKVLSTAAQMGISIEDLYTSMAVITSTGVSQAETVTYFKNMLNTISKLGDRSKITGGNLLQYFGELKKEMPEIEDQMEVFSNIRARSSVTALLGNTELYDEYYQAMMNCDGALSRMADTMKNTTSFTWGQTMAKLNDIMLQFGDRILPLVNKALDKFGSFIDTINLSDAQIDGIIKVAGVLASIGPGLLILGTAIKGVGNALKIANYVKGLGGIPKIIALIGSPLGVVLGIVAAIAAVAFIVYKNFDKIKPAIDRLLVAIRPLLDIIKIIATLVFSAIGGAFDSVVQSVGDFIVRIIDSITQIFSGIGEVFQGIFTGNFELIGQGLMDIFTGIGSGILTILLAPVRLIVSVVNGLIDGINKVSIKVPDWVPGIGGKDFGFNIPKIPEFASGIENFSGGLANINEKGGEIVDLPQGSRVIPHDVSMAMAKSGNSVRVIIEKVAESIVVNERSDIDYLCETLANRLERVYVNS